MDYFRDEITEAAGTRAIIVSLKSVLRGKLVSCHAFESLLGRMMFSFMIEIFIFF